MLRKPVLIGANPAIQLFDDEGNCSAYLSTWVVNWSIHGSGTAMVLWQPEGVRVIGDDRRLAFWLAEGFVRYFPELEGLHWTSPRFSHSRVRVRLDLASGLIAHGRDVQMSMSQVLDVRAFATDSFSLAGTMHSLSLIIGPCAQATIRAGGRDLPGRITLGGTAERRNGGTAERPSSSGFLTEAEVWRR